jgi:hypothetical protein
MYAAEIRKRALSGDGDAATVEDVLTAGVLGALDYLPEQIAIAAVDHLLEVPGFSPPVKFWESRRTVLSGILAEPVATEPDAVLYGMGWIAVVEAKCGAPFGHEQLARELDLLLQELQDRGITTGLLVLLLDDIYAAGIPLIGSDRRSASARFVEGILARLDQSRHGDLPTHWRLWRDRLVEVQVVVKHWDEALSALSLSVLRGGSPPECKRLVNDVERLLSRNGLIRPRAIGLQRFEELSPILTTSVRRVVAAAMPIDRLSRHERLSLREVPRRFRRRR